MPFEKTSRSPRFVNCRGKKRSRASNAASRGKPWNEVFAASTSMANVITCTAQYMKLSADQHGNTPRAICESTTACPCSGCAALHREPGDADEQRDRDHAEDAERRRSVACLRAAGTR